MRARAILIGMVLTAVALAGCSGSDGGGDTDPSGTPRPTVQPGKGAIVGVVVDEAVRPVAGVTVAAIGPDGARHDGSTDAQGTFRFVDVQPGSYFVTAQKAGYFPAQQTVDVLADVPDPRPVRLLMSSNPETRAFYETYVHRGFLECGAGAGGIGLNPCAASPNSRNVFIENLTAGRVPDWIQSEMTWQPASLAGQSLSISHYVPDAAATDGADDYDQRAGQSPLVVSANRTVLEARDVGVGENLGIRVFPSESDVDPATIVLQQEFDIITHVFYGYQPPAGWSFGATGEVPPPP